MKKLLFPCSILFAGAVACSDPPPPSLSVVNIHSSSNDESTSITYTRYDNDVVAGDASKGIVIADGLSIMLTLGRTISDPPTKRADADALKERPFKLAVNGDVISATNVTNESTRIIISANKLGTGSVVFSVDGAQGTVTMPITVVEQGQVPPDVRPPDLPKEEEDAGTNTSDAGAGADAAASDGG